MGAEQPASLVRPPLALAGWAHEGVESQGGCDLFCSGLPERLGALGRVRGKLVALP